MKVMGRGDRDGDQGEIDLVELHLKPFGPPGGIALISWNTPMAPATATDIAVTTML